MTAARYRAACAALGLPVWRPGMLSTHGARVLGAGLWASPSGVTFADENLGEEPDFTDPATLGCLLAAVREAWACPILQVSWQGPDIYPGDPLPETETERRWWRAQLPGEAFAYSATEAGALIAALEAAAARRGGQP